MNRTSSTDSLTLHVRCYPPWRLCLGGAVWRGEWRECRAEPRGIPAPFLLVPAAGGGESFANGDGIGTASSEQLEPLYGRIGKNHSGGLWRTMNLGALVFLIVSATGIMALPRKWAPIPLLATGCYMTIGQGIELGSISLPVYRLVLAAGLLRVILRREAMAGGMNTIDKLMITWAAWLVFASFFHESMPGAGPIYASGFVYNVMLVYFLTRVWCSDLSELMAMLRILAWLLVPVALAMLAEHAIERNIFGIFGGVPEGVYIRDGAIRAQGPFAHPILAGTVGAVCLPMMVAIWRRYRISAIIGLAACVAIVLASTSSGPLMSLLMGLFALLLWSYRSWLRVVQWAVIGAYVAAEILMARPAYYLMSKVDLTGSSTGWYRARLIQSAFEHLSEWWAFGTDYTGHWMATTLDPSGQHADITSYYIFVGIIGGLLAMLLLIAIMWRAFAWVGQCVRDAPAAIQEDHRFMIWCLGAGLFAHAGTSLSVAYTDQSMMFFWLNIGVISSMYSVMTMQAAAEKRAAAGRATPIASVSLAPGGGGRSQSSSRTQTTNAGRYLD